MNVTRSLLDDKNQTTSTVWTVQRMEEGRLPKEVHGMATVREKETRQTQTYLGGGDSRNDGRKGVTGRRLDR
jgi:hypothetical protein